MAAVGAKRTRTSAHCRSRLTEAHENQSTGHSEPPISYEVDPVGVLRKRRERRLRLERPHLVAAFLLFGWSVFLLLTLHIAEFMMWAYTLIYLGLIARAYDAIYFCANAYTTLGYGSVDLEAHWRLISPIIGISGLFTFAWTTSALIDVVSSQRQLIDQLEDERERH
jgi:4-amino-4-deoxy-L-arabinose transferase-like glycosyltransferase